MSQSFSGGEARDREYDPHFGELHDKGGAAVAEERQRDSRRRNGRRHHCDVEQRLKSYFRGKTCDKQGGEGVRRFFAM